MKRILIAALLAAVALGPAAAQQRPYKTTDDGVKPPVLVKEVKPKYTQSAMDRQVQGIVEVEAVVLADGTVGDVTVKKSLDSELDEEAVKATREWRFRPGTKDARPADVLVNIELSFTLKDKK